MPDTSTIEIVKPILESPWYAVIMALWVIGYLVKNQTYISNKFIPLIIVVAGGALGFGLIQSDSVGIIAGASLGLLSIGGHSAVKNSIEK
jgi:hypothetical protein